MTTGSSNVRLLGRRPQDAAEEDAARWPKVAGCPRYSNGHHCTRTLGHAGDHVRVQAGRVVGRWPAGDVS